MMYASNESLEVDLVRGNPFSGVLGLEFDSLFIISSLCELEKSVAQQH